MEKIVIPSAPLVRNCLSRRSDFSPPHAQKWLLTLLTCSDMFPGQMVPTIVSLVLPLSASRAHFLRKSAEMTMWGHFRRKSSKSQEWFLPATCPQVTSDASNLLRHVPWANSPDYCLFGFASIGLQSSFCQKKCQKEQKVPFFWPPKILYSFGESKKRPFIVILSPIPFGSCQNLQGATWAYHSYAKIFIFAGENRLGAKTF